MNTNKKVSTSGRTSYAGLTKRQLKAIIIMAMFNRISGVLTDNDIADIENAVDIIISRLPFRINLEPKERKRMRKTGNKREGYVKSVYEPTLANPHAIPLAFDVGEWTKDENLTDKLKYVYSVIMGLAESISDTLIQLGSERIKQADTCYDYLKRAAKDNEALSDIVNNIAKNFLGQGRAKAIPVTSIPAGGSVEVKKVVPLSYFSNMGETLLKLTAGLQEVLVRAGDVVQIPARITSIKVDNQSTIQQGKFSVKTR